MPGDLLHDAQLVMTELVTNGVRHGTTGAGQWVGVRAEPRSRGVRLEVCDPGPGFALRAPLAPSHRALSGRGLLIIDRLGSRWGAGRTAEGRWEVWVELDAPLGRSARPA